MSSRQDGFVNGWANNSCLLLVLFLQIVAFGACLQVFSFEVLVTFSLCMNQASWHMNQDCLTFYVIYLHAC